MPRRTQIGMQQSHRIDMKDHDVLDVLKDDNVNAYLRTRTHTFSVSALLSVFIASTALSSSRSCAASCTANQTQSPLRQSCNGQETCRFQRLHRLLPWQGLRALLACWLQVRAGMQPRACTFTNLRCRAPEPSPLMCWDRPLGTQARHIDSSPSPNAPLKEQIASTTAYFRDRTGPLPLL